MMCVSGSIKVEPEATKTPEIKPFNITNDEQQKEKHAANQFFSSLLGLYIVTVAGTNVLPQWLRFKHWKSWMRTELALWAIVLLSGVATYCAWYVAPFR